MFTSLIKNNSWNALKAYNIMECSTTKQFAWRTINLEIGVACSNIRLKSMVRKKGNGKKEKKKVLRIENT